MNEMIVEKLIQKISNLLEEVNDLNLQVRGIKPSQEVLNACNSRLDAIQGALKEVGGVLKEKRVVLTGMEGQLKVLAAELEVLKKALDALPAQIGIRPAAIQELKSAMGALFEQLRQPIKTEVRHHHVMKGPLIATLGYLMAGVFFVAMVHGWSRIALQREREIKYRWLQAAPIPEISPYLYYADSFYRSNPEQFSKVTTQLEELQERGVRLTKVSERAQERLQLLREVADEPHH